LPLSASYNSTESSLSSIYPYPTFPRAGSESRGATPSDRGGRPLRGAAYPNLESMQDSPLSARSEYAEREGTQFRGHNSGASAGSLGSRHGAKKEGLPKGPGDLKEIKLIQDLVHGLFYKAGILTSNVKLSFSYPSRTPQNLRSQARGPHRVFLSIFFFYYPLEALNIRR